MNKLSREELERMYHEKKMSASDIAQEYSTSEATVYRWMDRFDIRRRNRKESAGLAVHSKKPEKIELQRLYIIQRMSSNKIAEHYSVSAGAVIRWLTDYGIERRSTTESLKIRFDKNRPSKEELENLYKNKKMNRNELADKYGVAPSTIYRWMQEDGLESRSLSEARRLVYCKNKPSKEELTDLIDQNVPLSTIAETYRVTNVTISNWAEEFNIRKKPKKTTKNGSWKDENYAIEKALEIMQREGWIELPNQKVLQERNYTNLTNAMSRYYGGLLAFRDKVRAYIGRTSGAQPSLLEQYAGGSE